MMQVVLPRAWRIEFEQAARDRREDITYKEKQHRAQLLDRERDREEKAEARKQERDDIVAAALAVAPPEDIAAFRADLDTYDTATVEALMDNQEAMERNRRKLDEMLEQAAVLPDGRRVFKTRDSQRVFDEHGLEVPSDEIDPASISEKKPKWETFKAEKEERERLDLEAKELHAYQVKLDSARERLDKGEITKADLKKLETEIKADMPDAVRSKVGLEKPEPTTAPKPDAEAAPAPNALDAMLQKNGWGAAPSM